jgi:4-amino-4-deoxy-L-arabinose transferase-like glycosyltransferase
MLALSQHIRTLLSCLLDALTDPARRERSVALVLVAYAAIWTLYGTIAKSSQDIHSDMGEMFVWSREVILGTSKHPPLGAWLVRLWFFLFPRTDWAYYLLAIVLATAALWFAWTISARYLDREKRVAGIAFLTLVPFYNFHALKFNANSVMLPTWGAATWLFLRSFETRGNWFALLAGLAAGAAMLAKYWSIFLLGGLAIAAFTDPQRTAYLRSRAPYITFAVGTATLAPHFAWLIANRFSTFDYALQSHPATFWIAFQSSFYYVVESLAYLAVPCFIALVAVHAERVAIVDAIWPPDPSRRRVLLAFALPLILPTLGALATREAISSLWSVGSMTLFPIVLLSSPLVKLSRNAATAVLGVATAFPLAATLCAPAIAIVIHNAGLQNYAAHYSSVGRELENAWHETVAKPLKIVGSYYGFLNGIAFYLQDRPRTFDIITPGATPWIVKNQIEREGIAMVCPSEMDQCMRAVEKWTSQNIVSKRTINVSRMHFGMKGEYVRYEVFIVPPRSDVLINEPP